MQCLILHTKSQKESLYIPIKFPASYISMLKNSWNSLAPNVASPPMIKISTVPPRIMKTKAGFFACNYTIIKFTFLFCFDISTKYLQKSEVKKRFFSYQKPEGSGEMFYAFAKMFFFLVYFLWIILSFWNLLLLQVIITYIF